MSTDPLIQDFPSLSPYIVSGDNPISLIDINGEGPGYPDNHAVSKALIKYNPLIFQAFRYANNTSSIQLHMLSKGSGGQDAYGKAIGAVGEGVFATRLVSNPTETGSILNFGQRYGGYAVDLLQQTTLIRENEAAYGFELKVNYTDILEVSEICYTLFLSKTDH